MTELPAGIYERLVSIGLDRDLGSIDSDLVDRGSLDPVDLTRFLAVTSPGLPVEHYRQQEEKIQRP